MPDFVQAASNVTGLTAPASISVILANTNPPTQDTTAGNYLLVLLFGFSVAGTIADSQGNMYSPNVIGNGGVTEYRVNACVGGPLTVTFTFPIPPAWAGIVVAEYANAAVNIGDQLEALVPFGNSIGDFSQCPASGGNAYLLTTGSGLVLDATYSWPASWEASTSYGGSGGTNGLPLYVPNNLVPVTLEGATGNGTSGLTEPAWVSGGMTVDNTVSWQDSGITIPGLSSVALGILADQNGTFTLAGTGWVLRTSATNGGNTIALYEHGPDNFFSTYNVSISKTADTFDLAAQLAQITGMHSGPAPVSIPQIPPFTLPFKMCGPCRKGNLL